MRSTLLCVVVVAIGCGVGARSQPVIRNGSFEADAFLKSPGLAVNNGGVTGWEWRGHVGVNPIWSDPKARTGSSQPFIDNGRIPDGKQVALLQNVTWLSQRVAGFEAGKRYVVTFCENARQQRRVKTDPRLAVTLGSEVIVPEHSVQSVDVSGSFETAYKQVTSAVFTASADGAFVLAFATTVDGGVTVLLDRVAIGEVTDGRVITPTYADVTACPFVINGSFELERYGKGPGYAAPNGGIVGWDTGDGSVAVSPWWRGPVGKQTPVHDFTDNGVIPAGRQVVVLQSEGSLRQRVAGFRAGKRYQVHYHENARTLVDAVSPVLEVRLGGELIVSAHEVRPLEARGEHTLPYYQVESAPFRPPRDGAYVLEFLSQRSGRVSLLVDRVSIVELDAK